MSLVAHEPSSPAHPRFAGVHLVHAALRRELAAFPDAVRALGPKDAIRAGALYADWAFAVKVLTAHHEHEDMYLWPLLRARVPELRLLVDRLEADHHRFEQEADAVAASIRTLPTDPDAAAAVADAMTSLNEAVEAHVRVEEYQMLPNLAAVVGGTERAGSLVEALTVLCTTKPFSGAAPARIVAWLLHGHQPFVPGPVAVPDAP